MSNTDLEVLCVPNNDLNLLRTDLEALKLSVIQSSGAAGAAGAAQHAATAAAAALNTAGWNQPWTKPWASNSWAPSPGPWAWS